MAYKELMLQLTQIKQRWQLLGITSLIIAVYANTLGVPFYFDDFSSIVNNPAIRHWQDTAAIWNFSPFRFITYFSFSLNYSAHGLNLVGYHVVNIAIHIAASLAVFWFCSLLLRTVQGIEASKTNPWLRWLPLFAALIFAAHPLHTQAVTYIVQRAAALVALFYLLSMCCFLAGRMATQQAQRIRWWAGALLLALAALLSKQNAFTLPVAIVLLELAFFSTLRLNKFVLPMAGVLLVLVGVVAMNVLTHTPLFSLSALQNLSVETTVISRTDYFLTQLYVLWGYIGHFFWPAGLSLEYGIPLAQSLAEPRIALSLLGHLLVLAATAWAWQKHRLVAFGILFYYLAHAVESSFIPIRDLAFDHRAYLPDVGLILAVGVIALSGVQRVAARADQQLEPQAGSHSATFVLAALACVPLLLGAASWQRNALWGDALAFFKDAAVQNPEKSRLWSTLAAAYIQRGKNADGLIALENAEKTRAHSLQSNDIRHADQLNKMFALQGLGRRDEAIVTAIAVLQSSPLPTPEMQAKLNIKLGEIYLEQKRYPEAETCLHKAIEMDPRNLNGLANLAIVLAYTGRLKAAAEMLEDIQKKDPSVPNVAANLAQIQNALKR
jgi:tetratricopeptide (TPR) repeat protein